jgi:hypothetical protein
MVTVRGGAPRKPPPSLPGKGKPIAGVRDGAPGYLFAFSRGEKVVEVRDRMRGRASPFEGPRFIMPPALPGDTYCFC